MTPRDLGRIVLVLSGLWLVSPILFVSQLEGYTANILSLAISFGPDAPARLFPDLTLVGEYIHDTRIGLIALFHVLGRLTGASGGALFHAVMVAALIGVVVASLAIVRRFTSAGWATAVLAVLLIPGALETAFFFNDNLFSAALATGAVALAAWARGPAAYALAGAFLGYAILCRTDAVLALPLLAGVAWITLERPGAITLRAGVSAAGLLAVLGLFFLWTGVTPLDAVRVGPALDFPAPEAKRALQPYLILAFLGLPGCIFAAMGATLFWRETGWPFRLTFILYPLAATLGFAASHSGQVRHFYPLMIAVAALHVARALVFVAARLAALGAARAIWGGLLAVLALLAVLPPLGTGTLRDGYRLMDGPRSVHTGRLWMPLLWYRWQGAQNRAFAGAQDFVDGLAGMPSSTVLVSHFDDVAYLRLALLEAGYRMRPTAQALPDCARSGVLVFEKGAARVAVILSENQYRRLPLGGEETAAFFVNMALACPDLRVADRLFLTMMGRPDRMPNGAPPSGIFAGVVAAHPETRRQRVDLAPSRANLLGNPFDPPPSTRPERAVWSRQVNLFHAIPLRPAELDDIAARARRLAPRGFGHDDLRAHYAPIRRPTAGGRE